MTLPSLYQLSELVGKTVRRFPLSVIAAYVVMILTIVYNHHQYESLAGYIMTGVFAFPFAFAVDAFMEAEKVKNFGKFWGRVLALGLIVAAYYYIFRNLQASSSSDLLRFILLEETAWVLAFFAPYIGPNKANAFWQYSISLIVRLISAFIFFGILFFGIVILIQSVDYLFQISFDEVYYFDIWLVIIGVLVSMFFLAGVPVNPQRLEQSSNYPKFLRVLTEYFLVPLTFLYLLVLYAYSAKILFTWEWPVGEVSSWIVGFSVVGLFAYFFAYSAKEKFLHYVEFFKKWFFPLLLPLLLVLGLAVGMRIKDYGFTEQRYFVAAFGIWVLIMALYYIPTRSKNLKFMMISLFFVMALSIYGPQSAFEVSRMSQTSRLENLLVSNNMLVDGKVVKVADASKISIDDYGEINSLVWYLVQYHGVDSLQAWFNEDLASDEDDGNDYWNKADKVLGLMGFATYTMPFSEPGELKTFYVEGWSDCQYSLNCFTDVANYNYYLPITLSTGTYFTFDFKNKTYTVSLADVPVADGSLNTVLSFREQLSTNVILEVNMKDFSEYLVGKFSEISLAVPKNEMVFKFKGGELRIKNMSASFKDGQFENVDYMDADLLLK